MWNLAAQKEKWSLKLNNECVSDCPLYHSALKTAILFILKDCGFYFCHRTTEQANAGRVKL